MDLFRLNNQKRVYESNISQTRLLVKDMKASYRQGTALKDIINLKYVASQLLNTLVGSFGLAAAAPLTALIATGMYLQKPKPAELRAG